MQKKRGLAKGEDTEFMILRFFLRRLENGLGMGWELSRRSCKQQQSW
jgi:hypothetical protein